jgi:hypothetical protein
MNRTTVLSLGARTLLGALAWQKSVVIDRGGVPLRWSFCQRGWQALLASEPQTLGWALRDVPPEDCRVLDLPVDVRGEEDLGGYAWIEWDWRRNVPGDQEVPAMPGQEDDDL